MTAPPQGGRRVDRGTETGATTGFLTRLIKVVLLPFAALGALARGVGRAGRAGFELMVRTGCRVLPALGRTLAALERAIEHSLGLVGRALAPVGRLLVHAGGTATRLLMPIGRGMAHAGHAVGAVLWSVGCMLGVALATVGQGAGHVMRWAGTALGTAIRRSASLVARLSVPARHATQRASRFVRAHARALTAGLALALVGAALATASTAPASSTASTVAGALLACTLAGASFVLIMAVLALLLKLVHRTGPRLAHATRVALVRAGRMTMRLLTPIGRGLARAGRAVGSVGRSVGRMLGVALTAAGQALGRAGRTLAWLLAPVGHALGAALRALGRGLATVGQGAGHVMRWAGTALETAIRRSASLVTRLSAPARHATQRASRFVRTHAKALAAGLAAALIGTSLATVSTAPAGSTASAVAGALLEWTLAGAFLALIVAVLAMSVKLVQRTGPRLAYATHVAFARARYQVAAARATSPTSALTPTAFDRPAGAPYGRSQLDGPPVGARFEASVSHNRHLPLGAREIEAVVRIGSVGGVTSRDPSLGTELAEVIVLDCSGSMGRPWGKLRAALHATQVALEAMPDGTWFAIVAGNEQARTVFPPGGGLAAAGPETRRAARRALSLVWPEGGTAMGRWLLLARDLLATRPEAIAHAILLTDGRDESEGPDELRRALRSCRDRFQCDCRGVGTDWEVDEVRDIASSLLGTADIVPDPAGLEQDFRAMAEAASSRQVGRVSLQVWTPRGVTVRSLTQVAPSVADLTDRRETLDAHTGRYPTGAWATEVRDYHLCLEVPVRGPGEEMLAARVCVAVDGEPMSEVLVAAAWSADESVSRRVDEAVAHYQAQEALVRSVRSGLEARALGDEAAAIEAFGRAARLAAESGHDATLRLLEQVVEVDDAVAGTVRLRRDVDKVDEMALATRSVKTLRC